VAAVICMQPTVAGTLRSGRERMQATVIGAAFSLGALVLLEHVGFLQVVRPAVVGLTVLVVMGVCIRLRWFDSLVLAAATVVVIMVLPSEENIYVYSGSRTVVTFIGIIVATVVNALFLTPHHRTPLWQGVRDLTVSTALIYRQAVEAFCFRELDLARAARGALEESERVRAGVVTRMQWLEEETRLRRAVHWREEGEVEVLRRAVGAITAARQSTATIVEVTEQVLRRRPGYAREPARVYEILWELAQLSFAIFEQVGARLSGTPPQAGESVPTWTEEAHRRLIRAIRQAHTAPQDIFPLVEVAVVGFEVRRVTELAVELAEAVYAHTVREG
jgi:hypothetical protein